MGFLLGLFEISMVHSANSVAGSFIGKSLTANIPLRPECPFTDLACLKPE